MNIHRFQTCRLVPAGLKQQLQSVSQSATKQTLSFASSWCNWQLVCVYGLQSHLTMVK